RSSMDLLSCRGSSTCICQRNHHYDVKKTTSDERCSIACCLSFCLYLLVSFLSISLRCLVSSRFFLLMFPQNLLRRQHEEHVMGRPAAQYVLHLLPQVREDEQFGEVG